MIRFQCPKCNTIMSAPDDEAGSRGSCPKCRQRLLVPAAPISQGRSLEGSARVGQAWYVADGQHKLGPFSSSQLRRLAAAGQMIPTAMVLRDGKHRWVQASSVKGLFAPTVQSGARTPPPVREAAPSPSPTVSDIKGQEKKLLRSAGRLTLAETQQALTGYLCWGLLGALVAIPIVVVVLISLTGDKLTKANFDRIQNGMTVSEVESILGKCTTSNNVNTPNVKIGGHYISGVSRESLIWDNGVMDKMQKGTAPDGREKMVTVEFSNGKVVGKSQLGLN